MVKWLLVLVLFVVHTYADFHASLATSSSSFSLVSGHVCHQSKSVISRSLLHTGAPFSMVEHNFSDPIQSSHPLNSQFKEKVVFSAISSASDLFYNLHRIPTKAT
eukprot:Phypoly_transcript_30148.p1 GENE.Phypoly_transcript_30148~~Phypoly_transcript_30148.p1  ORF type:complete len:105 (+),score=8.97 Phypoly_transcript_30148:45-359(+)